MGNGARECKWRHAPEARAEDFEKSQWILGILKKSVNLPREKTVGFRLHAETRPVALWRVPHVLGGADGKARIERMCISLLLSKNLLTKM